MPALLTSTSISTILSAVDGSPMWPSTRATLLEAATSVDWVTFREFATTLKPCCVKAFTIPAPIPCEAPVTMAVFRWSTVVCLEKAPPMDQKSTNLLRLHIEDTKKQAGFSYGNIL